MYRAETARLRARSLEERRAALPQPNGPLPDAPAEQADSLLRWWEETYFRDRPEDFIRRLGAARLTRETVRPLLGVTAGGMATGELPSASWETVLDEALALMPERAPDDAADEAMTFANALAPFRAWARARLEACLSEGDAPGLTIDTEAVQDALARALTTRLTFAAAQLFTLRLHAARLTGRLRGDTPEARFAHFVRTELLERGRFNELLAEYPVLARTLATLTQHTAAAWCELVRHLRADRPLLGRLGAPASDRLTEVYAGLGDTHRGGRTVMRLTFASGFRVVYKPRPLAVDRHVQELLGWLNERGLAPAQRTVTILDRGDHGWMEFIQAGPCANAEQVGAYYRRQGALLAVLHLLDATDFHWENLIAAGEHPVLVDLETLFQARPRTPRGGLSPLAVRADVFHSLVVRTGLLPLRVHGAAGSADLSGLSDLSGQETPYRVPMWERENSDEMRLVYKRLPLATGDNVPRLDGEVMDAAAHEDALVEGFSAAYRLLIAERDALSAPNGPLRAFANDRVRHVLRETVEYALLVQGSYHPSTLRDGTDRDFLFDVLWNAARPRRYMARLTWREQEDLWDGDVPYFTARVSGRDLFDSRGRRVRNFLQSSGLERVLERLDGFNDAGLARQVHCIRSCLASTAVPPGAQPPSGGGGAAARPLLTEGALIAAAERAGEWLARWAVVEHGQAHWAGLQPLPVAGYAVGPVPADLYDGTGGIALFLAYLGRVTGRQEFEGLARAAYAGIRHQALSPERIAATGAFQGIPALLYTALHLAELWNEPGMIAELKPALAVLRRQIADDRQFDVMAGAAGAVLVLLRLHERHPRLGALALARGCGDHLLRHGRALDGGLAWPSGLSSTRPLLGLSHGAAGIGWALLELAGATGEGRYQRAGRAAFAYERAHYDHARENWPDYRILPGDDPTRAAGTAMRAWCHGSTGAGLVRLAVRRHAHDEAIAGEIETALRRVREAEAVADAGLCHGRMGVAELLLVASGCLGRPHLARVAQEQASAVAHELELDVASMAPEWPMMLNPGLMTGLAGVGYGLLRLAADEEVPSVLTLAGPPSRRSGQ